VTRAVGLGVDYLKRQQLPDGSWSALSLDGKGQRVGLTGLVTLALLTAGERADSPSVARALAYLGQRDPFQIDSTYAVALQTMVFAAASPRAYHDRIAASAAWLEQSQIRGDLRGGTASTGSWGYSISSRNGDNSNSQYALLGLNAAREAGVRVHPDTCAMARWYWTQCQDIDGGWPYKAEGKAESTVTMTAAGIASLAILGSRPSQSVESLEGDRARDCGSIRVDAGLLRGLDWLGRHFPVGRASSWEFYGLYGVERAGRLTGQRYFGPHDWYREGAEDLVRRQDSLLGSWKGNGQESEALLATSFAVLFLAKGRAPVLIKKLRHGPGNDWDNDPDDIRNLVSDVSTDWNRFMTWQVADAESSTVEDLLQAPLVFLNGHQSPELSERARASLRDYLQQGGLLFAEACCGAPGFNQGFRALVAELFPGPGNGLHLLGPEHPVWRTRFALSPQDHPLWGLEVGCRTVLIYSPGDLSCFWNRRDAEPFHPGVRPATQLGQNVVDYATGRTPPADKLTVREVRAFAKESPRRGALRIAKLRHSGDWNVAPLAVPNLMSALRRPPMNYDVVIDHYELLPEDPNLINFPLIYLHGRSPMAFSEDQLANLRHHLDPGGGTLFADAVCGSPAFDASFRAFIKTLLPNSPLVPIPPGDPIYTRKVGFDLANCQTTRAAGGDRGLPQLEGVKLDKHWVVIYSKYDIGCALENHSGPDCAGYERESALRIAANIVIYSTLP
jgi:hypothetical protein